MNKDLFLREYKMIDTSVCDGFIEYFNSNKNKQMRGLLYSGKVNIDFEQKKSTDITLDFYNDDVRKDCPLIDEYEIHLKKCVDDYIKEFPFCNQGSPWGIIEKVNLQQYKPGEGFKSWHCERQNADVDRFMVFMTYLNDVEEGGTEFYHQKITTQAKKGHTIIWPAGWEYTHRGVVSKTETKYILTGWFSYHKK